MKQNRLFIVSNRLPVTVSREAQTLQVHNSSGGLVTAINSFLQKAGPRFTDIWWAGVPGCAAADWKEAGSRLDHPTYTYLPVHLQREQYEKYYNGFSNSALWPLFHYFPSYAEYSADCYEQYLAANEHFAEVLLRQVRPGDTVWIHDYHLLPLARLLREALPGLSIGLFLHIPFPSYELFRLLPKKWQEELLKGMLGADLIGFHTIDYAAHFLQSIQMIIGLDHDRHLIRYSNRIIKVDVFPISIDYQAFHEAYDDASVSVLRQALQQKLGGQKIIFSVDRLDYTKGVHNRLKAYELFLRQHPGYRNKVVFVLVIVPSRDSIARYAERKKMIDEQISQINSRVGNIYWQPVLYQYSHLQFDEMLALYTACHLALITPLRDGMNLVAKEFVASRKDRKGVLVISEMAGAARELTDALTINPNDTEEMAQKIRQGLELPEPEQAARLENMQRRIATYDVQAWADDFLSGLQRVKERQRTFGIQFLDEPARLGLLDAYRSAGKRLILLDYDGTLVPFDTDPEAAVPGAQLVQLLQALGSTPGNDLFLISGRSSAWLDRHFGALPLNLMAEHGARCRWKGGPWTRDQQAQHEWKEQVGRIMESYVRRCAHTFVEKKECSMVWHYRKANIEQGKLRSSELVQELNDHIHNRHLQVLIGNKTVEVRNSGIDKETAVRKILLRRPYDFIFAAGADPTDENMFRLLAQNPHCFSIRVGAAASYAQYNLHTPQMVVSLLEHMNHIRASAPCPGTAVYASKAKA